MMTAQTTDEVILAAFATTRDPAAFEELVRRYSGLVYSTALRQLRDVHLAEDVTQAVFIVLARHAGSIRKEIVLASWFFTVTRHAVANARRMQSRRRYHESRKAAMTMTESAPPVGASSPAEDISPLLDEAMARLSEAERGAILLRYFEGRSHQEIGGVLALSADTSRKRVERALLKMRTFLERRGVTTSDAALGAVLGDFALAPQPVGLVDSIVNIAVLSDSVAIVQGTAAASIARGATQMMITSRLKPAIAACAAVVIVSVAVAQTAKTAAPKDSGLQAPAVAAVASPGGIAANASGDFVVEVSRDIKIHLLGIAPFMGEDDSWFALNGEPIKVPDVDIPHGQLNAQPAPDYQLLVKFEQPPDVTTTVKIPDAEVVANMASGPQRGDRVLLCAFKPAAGDGRTTSLEIGIADADWTTLVANETPNQPAEIDGKEFGTFNFLAIEDSDGGASVTVEHASRQQPFRIVAVDDKGVEHRPNKMQVQSDGEQTRDTCGFTVPAGDVKKIVVKYRPFSKMVEVNDISLEKGRFTKPQITIRDAKPESGVTK